MRTVLDYMRKKYPNVLIEFSAQTYLVPFYQKLGFEVIGDEYDEGGISHYKMRGKNK